MPAACILGSLGSTKWMDTRGLCSLGLRRASNFYSSICILEKDGNATESTVLPQQPLIVGFDRPCKQSFWVHARCHFGRWIGRAQDRSRPPRGEREQGGVRRRNSRQVTAVIARLSGPDLVLFIEVGLFWLKNCDGHKFSRPLDHSLG